MVGYLDMTDRTQQCPDSWQKIASPRSSCGKNSGAFCDSLIIPTSGASYQTVCGRFRGYQVGSPDAFRIFSGPISIETFYVDGVTVTYGPPGRRHHVFTYAAGVSEMNISSSTCPCVAGGHLPPLFVGSDYYCESGCPGPDYVLTKLYFSDVLWDGQQCGGNEITCCNASYLPWFCKTFPTPISEDLEVRICTDEDIDNENVAIESFELYIQVLPYLNTSMASSIDTYAIIGITISASFVVFFSLGVLVAICIGCMVAKRRSKGIPVEKPSVYETVGLDQMQIAVEAHHSYEVVGNNKAAKQPEYI
ncbi:hypothetical protein EMCRGX_G003938 [Ephydatia muelleri]